jgi:nitroreductase
MQGFKKKDAASAETLRKLPAPTELDKSLEACFRLRRSNYEFSEDPIIDADLSTILWAADGLTTKKEGLRTTPSVLEKHCVSIYVVKSNGVWLWDNVRRALVFLIDKDCRADVCLSQPLIENAPVHLIYVANPIETHRSAADYFKRLFERKPHEDDVALREFFKSYGPAVEAGAKVEAVYLACASLSIRCLARMSFDPKRVKKALRLTARQRPLCAQTLGYKPKSIFDIAL